MTSPGPFAAFAGGIVHERVLRARTESFGADAPDLIEKFVAALERAARRAEIGALQKIHRAHAYLVRIAQNMDLRIPTAARRQVSERVFPLRKAVAVEIARIPRRKGDERRYAAVLQSFGIRDLEERARGRVDLGRKSGTGALCPGRSAARSPLWDTFRRLSNEGKIARARRRFHTRNFPQERPPLFSARLPRAGGYVRAALLKARRFRA